MKNNIIKFSFLLLLFFESTFLEAANGINPIGFGARSSLVGGADIAFPQDSLTININPAGLSNLDSRFDIYIQPFLTWNSHEDKFSGKVDSDLKNGAVAGIGFATAIDGSPITIGTALLVQGGVGFTYKDINTQFGTSDNAESLFTAIKLSQSLSWEVNEKLSIGVALSALYTESEASIFPNTSFYNSQAPEQSFFGMKIWGLSGLTFGGNIGVLFKANEKLNIGLAYMPKLPIELENGKLELDYSGLGLGKVEYSKASVKKMSFPEQLGLGIDVMLPDGRSHLLAELNWVNWSSSIDRIKIFGDRASNENSPQTVHADISQEWRDQYISSVGFYSEISKRTTLLAGVNYGKSQIPDKNLNPIFSAKSKYHATFGADFDISETKSIVIGLEYQFLVKENYENKNSPFGLNSKEENEVLYFHIMFSKKL